jgi:hypothetical protein
MGLFAILSQNQSSQTRQCLIPEKSYSYKDKLFGVCCFDILNRALRQTKWPLLTATVAKLSQSSSSKKRGRVSSNFAYFFSLSLTLKPNPLYYVLGEEL